MRSRTINEYVRLCFQADREPNVQEYLSMFVKGTLPQWIKELS